MLRNNHCAAECGPEMRSSEEHPPTITVPTRTVLRRLYGVHCRTANYCLPACHTNTHRILTTHRPNPPANPVPAHEQCCLRDTKWTWCTLLSRDPKPVLRTNQSSRKHGCHEPGKVKLLRCGKWQDLCSSRCAAGHQSTCIEPGPRSRRSPTDRLLRETCGRLQVQPEIMTRL